MVRLASGPSRHVDPSAFAELGRRRQASYVLIVSLPRLRKFVLNLLKAQVISWKRRLCVSAEH